MEPIFNKEDIKVLAEYVKLLIKIEAKHEKDV